MEHITTEQLSVQFEMPHSIADCLLDQRLGCIWLGHLMMATSPSNFCLVRKSACHWCWEMGGFRYARIVSNGQRGAIDILAQSRGSATWTANILPAYEFSEELWSKFLKKR